MAQATRDPGPGNAVGYGRDRGSAPVTLRRQHGSGGARVVLAVRDAAEQHGGTIGAAGESGRGVTFAVRLPL